MTAKKPEKFVTVIVRDASIEINVVGYPPRPQRIKMAESLRFAADQLERHRIWAPGKKKKTPEPNG